MSRYPFPPFPDGWFLIAASAELAIGDVKAVRFFGQDLVLFRNQAGEPVLLDAYCPHMGAHLGYGGTVDGDGVRCPFHNWKFDAAGHCADAPYSTRATPPNASVGRWQLAESDGLILVLHDATGRGRTWRKPSRPEYASPGWIGYESVSWTVRMHTQEVAENVPDISHFLYVHTVPTLPVAEVEIEGDVWRQNTVGRTEQGVETWRTQQELFGLGLIWLSNETPLTPATLHFLTAITPIDDEQVSLRLLFLAQEGADAQEISEPTRAMISMIAGNTARDVPIWEHKIYQQSPHLVPGDGPIGRLRHWARQFYGDPPVPPVQDSQVLASSSGQALRA